MKASDLKNIIKEALTPDEAAKVNSKYREIYAGMLQDNPLKLKKYDNPDKVAYGRAIKLIQRESAKIAEKKLTAAEKAKKEDIVMALKKQRGGKDKLKSSDYAYATATAIDVAEEKTGPEIAKKNMDMYKDKNRLTELVKAALMGPINETLDDKVYDLVDRMLDAMGGSDNLLEELIRAMSTDDAMFYLSAIARDYDILDDAEEISEKKTDQDKDGDNDFDDVKIARMKASGMSHDDAVKKVKGKVDEAEVNEMKMMDFAKLSKEETLSERVFREIRALSNLNFNDDFNDFYDDGESSTSSDKYSFEGEWVDVENINDFKKTYNLEPTSPLNKIVSRYIGKSENHAITKDQGKYYVYSFRIMDNPGDAKGPYSSIKQAKDSIK